MKTCKDCRKFDTPRCMFNGTARATWQGCNQSEMMPDELQKAQWWFVGWRRLWQDSSILSVNSKRIKADTRFFAALREQAKEVTK